MIKDESLYIAGPLCFYKNGYGMWDALKKEAEFYGFTVALPNNNVLEYEEGNKRQFSAAIFKNCRDSINKTTCLIVNLENYRGLVPDGGSVYEMGMAYAKGARLYGFTRDKRPARMKYGLGKYVGNDIIDCDGRLLAHKDLAFGPCIVGSTKIVEGKFGDALQSFMTDIEEDSKLKASRNTFVLDATPQVTVEPSDKPRVYLSTFERYDNDAKEKLDRMKKICKKYGFEAISPLEDAPKVERIVSDDVMEMAYNQFDHYQQHVRNCDIILANLNNYHGYEPNDDVSFECGMAFQLGKKCFGYLNEVKPMIDLVPNRGPEGEYRDLNDMNVENFDNPLNLMFGASFTLFEGQFEEAVKKMAEALVDFKLADDLVPPVLD